MRVISDAGPLIALAKLGQLGLLIRLCPEVLIARQVYDEVVTRGLRLGAPDARSVDLLVRQGHIRVVEVTLASPPPVWAQAIDPGEFAVISLAQQQSVDWVLVDDAHARRAARQAGLRPRGTVGFLLDAFRAGHLTLPEFELLMDSIKARPALWISDRLCDEARREARRQGS